MKQGKKSGALINAQLAEKLNRQVLAVPGQIYGPESSGCNQLIAKGARVYIHPSQLLLDAGREEQQQEIITRSEEVQCKVEETTLTEIEKEIYNHFSHVPQSIEQLASVLGSNTVDLLRILCTMELKGKIEMLAGGKVRRNKRTI